MKVRSLHQMARSSGAACRLVRWCCRSRSCRGLPACSPCPSAEAATIIRLGDRAASNLPVMTRPLLITAMRSDSAMTSSRSEVTNRMAEALAPRAGAWCGRHRPWRRRRCRGWARPSAGTFGLVSSALPMTTFCWLPPDSELTSNAGSATLIDRSLHDRGHRLAFPRERRCSSQRLSRPRLDRVMLAATERMETRPSRWRSSGIMRQARRDAPGRVQLRDVTGPST